MQGSLDAGKQNFQEFDDWDFDQYARWVTTGAHGGGDPLGDLLSYEVVSTGEAGPGGSWGASGCLRLTYGVLGHWDIGDLGVLRSRAYGMFGLPHTRAGGRCLSIGEI